MNTGIQDAHNLAWKLASVLRSRAYAATPETATLSAPVPEGVGTNAPPDDPFFLLRTYDAERRAVAWKNTQLRCVLIENELVSMSQIHFNTVYTRKYVTHILPADISVLAKTLIALLERML